MKKFIKLLALISIFTCFTFTIYASSPDLYIQWETNTVTINFNANGGSGTMKAQTFKYGDVAKLNTNEFTKDGYFFIGWSTQPNGEIAYTNNDDVSNLAKTNNGDITLFAQWEERQQVNYETGVDNTIPGIYYADDYEVVALRGTLMYSWDELVDMGLDIEQDYPTFYNGSFTEPLSDKIYVSNQPYSSSYRISVTQDGRSMTFNGGATKSAAYVLGSHTIPGTNKRIVGQIIFPPDIKKIGDYQFYHAFAIKGKLTIPEGLTTIGNNVFDRIGYEPPGSTNTSLIYGGVTGDITIPDTVTSIGRIAFWGCGATGTLTIGANVKSIGYQAFQKSKFSKAIFKNPNGWRSNSTSLSLSNTSTNANYLSNAYSNYEWTRN